MRESSARIRACSGGNVKQIEGFVYIAVMLWDNIERNTIDFMGEKCRFHFKTIKA